MADGTFVTFRCAKERWEIDLVDITCPIEKEGGNSQHKRGFPVSSSSSIRAPSSPLPPPPNRGFPSISDSEKLRERVTRPRGRVRSIPEEAFQAIDHDDAKRRSIFSSMCVVGALCSTTIEPSRGFLSLNPISSFVALPHDKLGGRGSPRCSPFLLPYLFSCVTER